MTTTGLDFAPVLSKESLGIHAAIECGFTLKRVRDMIRTCNHIASFENSHHTTCRQPTKLRNNGVGFFFDERRMYPFCQGYSLLTVQVLFHSVLLQFLRGRLYVQIIVEKLLLWSISYGFHIHRGSTWCGYLIISLFQRNKQLRIKIKQKKLRNIKFS